MTEGTWLLGAAWAALAGAAGGSAIGVVAERWGTGARLFWGRSRCEECGVVLGIRDLVPVVSYLLLRGRCRRCRAPIPLRLWALELSGAALGVVLWSRWRWDGEYLAGAALLGVLLACAAVDLRRQVIPNGLVALGALVALAGAPWGPGLASAALGAGVGLGAMLAWHIAARGALGGGDVKLALVLGLALGFPGVLVALLLAVAGGAAIVGALWALGRVRRRALVPFGPFLVAGGIVAWLEGEAALAWYLGLWRA